MLVRSSRLLVEVRPSAALESLTAAGSAWASVPRPAGSSAHPWDEAHRVVQQPAGALESMPAASYAEPDFVQAFPFPRPDSGGLESFSASPCEARAPDGDWPVGDPAMGWHLDEQHSRLKAARDRAGDPGDGGRIRIGHLDTGYDPEHASRPLHLLTALQRNFAEGDPGDATDPGRHFPGNQPGHGTATLALLAGRRLGVPGTAFDDFVGGAPFAEVVPIRIADSVIHFYSSAMADGIDYAVAAGCRVVSISMGGLPTRAWAAAVNRAYEAGVAIFAAAGNRFGPAPPVSIVWPARFARVVAVCGVTADGTAYHKSGLHRHMHGCFGPPAKMETALAAYTPNAPWAMMGCGGVVGFGGGTSSATPQAAAAAALWLQSASFPEGTAPWQHVEAVRHALFESADRSHPEFGKYFGRGVLKAAAALDQPFRSDLPMSPVAEVSFPWLRAFDVLESLPNGTERMYEVEALHVYLQTPALQTLAGGADPLDDRLTPAEAKPVLKALANSPSISRALRQHLTGIVRGSA